MNQCDGCARRLPVKNGLHVEWVGWIEDKRSPYFPREGWRTVMACTKPLYSREPQPAEPK